MQVKLVHADGQVEVVRKSKKLIPSSGNLMARSHLVNCGQMAACFLEVPESVLVREATPAEEVIPPARLRKMFASWIIYKDADVVAINKPGGFSSQGVSQSVSQSVSQ